MKFCQSDGTLLVSEGTQQTSTSSNDYDPYKTVLGNSIEVQSSEQSKDDESDYDPMKTMLGTPPVDLPPPSPFEVPASNQSSNANLNSTSFGDLSSSTPLSSTPFDQPLRPNESSNPFGQQSSGQFGESSRTPTYKEPEPFEQNFGQQPSFGQTANEWTPPLAPQQNWGNQGLGQNTPFGAPPIGAGGKNQTLAIVSLVCGILSCLCCFSIITGPAGLIMGFMARNKANQQPDVYTGQGLALGGMITGAFGTVIGIIVVILQIFGMLIR